MPDNLLESKQGAPARDAVGEPADRAADRTSSDPDDPLAAFRTGPDGALDPQALADAYLKLKEAVTNRVALPGPDMADEDRRRLYAALGVPESPDGYDVALSHSLFERDPDIEKTLHEAGFSTSQVQLVYDLAAERMMPFVEEIAGELKAENDQKRLIDAFGGEDRWREVSRQLLKWGRKNLSGDVVETLSTSYEGVMALHRMMTGEDKPGQVLTGGDGADKDEDLDRMMRDPKYWKEKDPSFVRKVTEGFKRLYPDA
ncbi:hypothetical protein [Fodinicurvata sp. EGI_FJ10296]|uniref:capsid assembly protein n=1 Tax=Fodinicurvata sp. EGI_FJ10296 TaxID=3231908 RepID=UPI003451EFC7